MVQNCDIMPLGGNIWNPVSLCNWEVIYGTQCHYATVRQHMEVAKNGQGDLAVMSIATYERLVGKFELCKLLDEGMEAVKSRRVVPAESVFNKIENGFSK